MDCWGFFFNFFPTLNKMSYFCFSKQIFAGGAAHRKVLSGQLSPNMLKDLIFQLSP